VSLWTIQNEQLRLNFHPGQLSAWDSLRRFIFILAGTQGGKTSFLPFWLYNEIQRTADPNGNNDYLAITANYDLFKLKFLPEMRQVFEYLLKWGRYWAGERIIELRDPVKGFWAKRTDDPMWGRIILRSAASPAGLESATAKAAILDEAGQDEYTLETWEAILRRLSLYQGRVCAATTLYNLGWIKSEIYDAWKDGDSDIDVFQFASIQNPAFPKAEFERARTKMQDWRFAMFYLGQFAKPAGLIYSAFTDAMLVDPFPIPPDWDRVIGLDFGGANTAKLWLAQNPDSEVWYVYRESLEGDKSSQEHVNEVLEIANSESSTGEFITVGGAASETQYRMDWDAAGLLVLEPPIKDVENGIDRVTELIKTDKFRVFRSLSGLRDELGSYRRKLDESGNATDEILNKRHYHRLDALRYAAAYIKEPISELQIFTVDAY
jgi:hypothetical protein